MFLFAFNLYKQINLFTKHIFANKDITIPYYIYSCFALSSPFLPILMLCQPGALLVVPSPPPAGEAACRPSPSSQLLEAIHNHHQPGKLPAGSVRPGSFPLRASSWLSFIPSGHITPDHRQGARTSLLRAAGSLAPESKLQE